MTTQRALPRLAIGWALCSFTLAATADVIALKRDAGLVYDDPGGSTYSSTTHLHANFRSLGSDDVVLTTVKDTYLNSVNMNSNQPWYNYGATGIPPGDGTGSFLFSFDFSVLSGFRRSAIIRAELRLYFRSGNTGYEVGRVLTGWSEGNKDGAFAGADPAAPGASFQHPNGLNTGRRQADDSTGLEGSWLSGSFSGLGLDGDMARNKKSSNYRWSVYDVTDIVQSWADGANNLGFWYRNHNYTVRLSEAGTERQPVLFVEYKPAVPSGTLMLVR